VTYCDLVHWEIVMYSLIG